MWDLSSWFPQDFVSSVEHMICKKYIHCTEASIFLAYSTYERTKDVSTYMCSGKIDGDIEAIHPLLKPDKHAKLICEQKMVSMILSKHRIHIFSLIFAIFLFQSKRTYQGFSKLIAGAREMKRKIDIFLVVVNSVARFCRQGSMPEREFAEYKAKFNALPITWTDKILPQQKF